MLRPLRPLYHAASAALILCACSKDQDATADSPALETASFTSDRIAVETQGNGPDVVLIHGLAGHRDVWAEVADSLDETYQLHLVQVKGFGGAPAEANATAPVASPVAEEIARYLRETELDSAAVIGHSLGGSIGMMLAARHPELVGKLMLVDAPPFIGAALAPPGSGEEAVAAMANQFRDSILAAPAAGGLLERMVATMVRDEDDRQKLVEYARASDRATVANAFHEAIVTDLRPELPRIKAALTALYVVPTGQPMSVEEFDRAMRAMFSNAPQVRLVRIDSSNHYLHLDQPGRFVSEVRSFMTR